jgi:hypothetical protein
MAQRLRLPESNDEHMPPMDHPQLSSEELSLIERWIDEGADRVTSVLTDELPKEYRASARRDPGSPANETDESTKGAEAAQSAPRSGGCAACQAAGAHGALPDWSAALGLLALASLFRPRTRAKPFGSELK